MTRTGTRCTSDKPCELSLAHVLFAWIRWRLARSLFPVVIAHASVNAPFFFWEQVATGPTAALLTRSSILAEASFVVVAIVLVKIEWRWWWIRPKRDATLPAAPPPDRC